VKLMRICISINDTAQVHFWKVIIRVLKDQGHEVIVLGRDFGETSALLKETGIPYYPVSSDPGDGIRRYIAFPSQVLRMYGYLKDKDIDLIAGFGGFDSLTGFLLRIPDVAFQDSEPRIYPRFYSLVFRGLLRFMNTLLTPACFHEDLGRRHVRVDSYKELAYLHPRYFRPDGTIFDLLGIPRGSAYFVLRFNGFGATHDTSVTGFDNDHKIALVRALEKHGHVFISSEAGVPDEIKDRLLSIPKSRIHDVMYHARMLVTDTATMATEASLLGTPVVRTSSFVRNDFGIMIELEKKYGLVMNYLDPGEAVAKAAELAWRADLKAEWAWKRERLLRDKIDMVQFMAWFLENYPGSLKEVRRNSPVLDTFRPQEPQAYHGQPHSLPGPGS
jgi:predicted glycosyltransferase